MSRALVTGRLHSRGVAVAGGRVFVRDALVWLDAARARIRGDTDEGPVVVWPGAVRAVAKIRGDTGGTLALVWPDIRSAAPRIRRDTGGTFARARPGAVRAVAKIRRANRRPISGTPQALRPRPAGLGHEPRTGHPPPAPHVISP
jgi:hypothetical protein